MLKYAILLVCIAAIGCGGDDQPASFGQPPAGSSGGGSSGRDDADAGAAHGGERGEQAGAAAVGGDAKSGAGRGESGAGAGEAGAGGMTGAGGMISGGAAGASAPDLTAELFDQEKLPRFDITLSDEARAALGKDPETYVKGTLQYGDTTLQDVGVRIKGEASLRTLNSKAAFKVKVDEFVSNQALLGLHRLTLNNMVADPSFIAERLTYQVYRAANLPAPRCNNALVYVNGDFFGVYANVESEDKPFLRRWFASDAGNLYEDGQTDFTPGHEASFDLETNETKNDRSDLTALISAIDTAKADTYLADLDATLDTEHFLRYTALEAAVNQWDGYSYTYFEPNNFRIYHDPSTGKFRFIPWGMDMSMKPFDSTRANIQLFTIGPYEGKDGARAAGGLIFKRCLDSSTCKSHYASVVREMMSVFDGQKLAEAAAHHYAQIKDHVYDDYRKEVSNAEFEAAYQSVLTTIGARTRVMNDELDKAGL
jgi:spore coat protein CotH